MTIAQILAVVDETRPNQFDENIKIGWLSELDGRIFNEVILTHAHDKVDDGEGNMVEPTFTAYSQENEDEQLIIPDTYADIYRHYLFAQIDYSIGETDRFQNSMIMFNSSLQQYKDWYNSNNKPNQVPLKLI